MFPFIPAAVQGFQDCIKLFTIDMFHFFQFVNVLLRGSKLFSQPLLAFILNFRKSISTLP
jgi:hypothetical protein